MIIPAQVEEAGEGKGEGSVGRKENSYVNINYFLKVCPPHPTQGKKKIKKESSDSDSGSHVEQTMFPEFGWFRAGSLVGFGRNKGGWTGGGWGGVGDGDPLPVPAETGTGGPTLGRGSGL